MPQPAGPRHLSWVGQGLEYGLVPVFAHNGAVMPLCAVACFLCTLSQVAVMYVTVATLSGNGCICCRETFTIDD